MKAKPIIFNSNMVLALLSGNKSQTRRIINPSTAETFALLINLNAGVDFERCMKELLATAAPYQKGDHLWVRESFYPKYVKGGLESFKIQYPGRSPWVFRADNSDYNTHGFGWKPSIHMPCEAARIILEVISVKAEKLQQISKLDAIKEGIESGRNCSDKVGSKVYRLYGNSTSNFCDDPISSFKSLWFTINGIEEGKSWSSNPWVWVIEFKIISKSGINNININKETFSNG